MPHTVIRHLNPEVLRDWPLPMPSEDGDKNERGRILVVGGSREMPGAVILAANAALRAGAGKLAIATGESVAQLVALAIPESRVIGLPETSRGGLAPRGVARLESVIAATDAILIGPGTQDEDVIADFVGALLPLTDEQRIVLDAGALHALPVRATGSELSESSSAAIVRDLVHDPDAVIDIRMLVTPHAGEMAHMLSVSKELVQADPSAAARTAAQRWGVMTVLKGATTLIAAPNGSAWRHDGGNIGLAISGSGDVLAGVIAGLAARGAPLEQAGAWGVTLHAQAGDALAERHGPLGYLASEIAAEIPRLMHAFSMP
jgi:ADP-dependent NAD(P)H-hydrate dehydratase